MPLAVLEIAVIIRKLTGSMAATLPYLVELLIAMPVATVLTTVALLLLPVQAVGEGGIEAIRVVVVVATGRTKVEVVEVGIVINNLLRVVVVPVTNTRRPVRAIHRELATAIVEVVIEGVMLASRTTITNTTNNTTVVGDLVARTTTTGMARLRLLLLLLLVGRRQEATKGALLMVVVVRPPLHPSLPPP